MKRKPKPFQPSAVCFIKDHLGYRKITCGELNQMKLENPEAFKERWFIPVEGFLLEVSYKDYQEYYQMKERWDYLIKLDKKNHPISLERIPAGVKAEGVDVHKVFEADAMIKALKKALSDLNEDERDLINALFYEEQTVMDISRKYQLPLQTIYSRKRKVLDKLRRLIEQ